MKRLSWGLFGVCAALLTCVCAYSMEPSKKRKRDDAADNRGEKRQKCAIKPTTTILSAEELSDFQQDITSGGFRQQLEERFAELRTYRTKTPAEQDEYDITK